MLRSHPYGDGTWRWGLWAVTSSRGWSPHEWDWCPSKKRPESWLALFLLCEKTRKQPLQPRKGPQDPTVLGLWPWASSVYNCEKEVSVVHKLPNVQCLYYSSLRLAIEWYLTNFIKSLVFCPFIFLVNIKVKGLMRKLRVCETKPFNQSNWVPTSTPLTSWCVIRTPL